MSQNVLNQTELANFLGISRKTVRKLVEDGEIPGRKIGTRYFFDQEIVKKWLAGKGTDEKVGSNEGEIVKLRREIKRLEEENKELEKENLEYEELVEGMRPLMDIPCSICGESLSNKWTAEQREKLVKMFHEHGWAHTSCLEEKKRKEAQQSDEAEQGEGKSE